MPAEKEKIENNYE